MTMLESAAVAVAGDDFKPGASRSPNAWPGVVSMALGTFSLVTVEFLPAGLLTPMARGLDISAAAAGQAVTATAAAAFVAAPTLGIITGRLDRRLVLWGLSALLIVSCLLTYVAGGLAELLLARILLGIALGGFWSMSAAVTLRLVAEDLVPRAMSIVLTGVSLATVCAVPLGAWVGDLWGWRTAFLIAAGFGLLTLGAQIATIPRLPPIGNASFGGLVDVLRRPAIRLALVAILLTASAHFAGFTYVRLFLERVPKLDIAAISGAITSSAYGHGYGQRRSEAILRGVLAAEAQAGECQTSD